MVRMWKQVKGYSGAEYKSFGTREEAETYIINSQPSNNTLNDSEKENIIGIHIYVDGSYSDTVKCAAYGYVVVEDDREIYRDYSTVIDDIEIRNVAGELQATIEAINWAIKNMYWFKTAKTAVWDMSSSPASARTSPQNKRQKMSPFVNTFTPRKRFPYIRLPPLPQRNWEPSTPVRRLAW